MSKVEVFDKPMCCSTGVCGPDVDPVLPRFAGDLEWLKSQGHQVERFNLAQQPDAFLQNRQVQQVVTLHGTKLLPIVVVNGRIVSRGTYPSRDDLAQWADGETAPASLAILSSSCCGDPDCC